jgi:hypothetical protein
MKNAPMRLAKGREDFEDQLRHAKSTVPAGESQDRKLVSVTARCEGCAEPLRLTSGARYCQRCLAWDRHQRAIRSAVRALEEVGND